MDARVGGFYGIECAFLLLGILRFSQLDIPPDSSPAT